MKVSIIMPVRNGSQHIVDCIESIVNQSYRNWELWITDDGSSDHTADLIDDYANRDPRINYSSTPPFGIVNALQIAYKNTTGDAITRMDSDDLMPRHKLKIMVDLLTSHPESVITGKVEYFSDTELNDGYVKYANWLNQLIDNQTHYQEIYKECVIPSPAWLLTRETFEKIGAFNQTVYPEDYDFSFRLYASKIPVIGAREIVHKWRDHADRTSRNSAVYADNRFLELKVRHYAQIDHQLNTPLVIWGAGAKGKKIAQLLQKQGIPFRWICDNPNKIGHDIYGVILSDTDSLEDIPSAHVIIAVATPDDRPKIAKVITNGQHQAFWFC